MNENHGRMSFTVSELVRNTKVYCGWQRSRVQK